MARGREGGQLGAARSSSWRGSLRRAGVNRSQISERNRSLGPQWAERKGEVTFGGGGGVVGKGGGGGGEGGKVRREERQEVGAKVCIYG